MYFDVLNKRVWTECEKESERKEHTHERRIHTMHIFFPNNSKKKTKTKIKLNNVRICCMLTFGPISGAGVGYFGVCVCAQKVLNLGVGMRA